MGLIKTLFCITLTASLLMGFWAFKEHQELTDLRLESEAKTKLLAEQKKKIDDISHSLDTEKHLIQGEKNQAKADLENLGGQLQAEFNRLESQRQNINDLKAQLRPQDNNLAAKITQQNNLVNDLEARLKQAKNAEKDVNNVGNDALRNTKVQTQFQTQNYEAQIKTQQALIKSTQEQLNFWRNRKKDPNQTTQIEKYQSDLSQQMQGLQQLQALKLNAHETDQMQSVNIKQAVADEQDQIKASERQLQDQLQRAQQELKGTKEQQLGSLKNSLEIKNKIQQLEQSYAVDYARYQTLRDAIKKKQSEMQKLPGD